jgi:hypothetical protein
MKIETTSPIYESAYTLSTGAEQAEEWRVVDMLIDWFGGAVDPVRLVYFQTIQLIALFGGRSRWIATNCSS